MAKVRLKSPAMKGFSSFMGVTKFENGVSVDHVSDREAKILGSITAVEMIDDEGNVIGNAGMAQVQVDKRSDKAPVEAPKIMGGEYEHKEEINADPVLVTSKKAETDEADDEAEKLEQEVQSHEEEMNAETEAETQTYTRDQLEEIADTDGIQGLREIGAKRDVKSNSIEDLISKILQAQG